jgi:serine/threonine protein phosphatase PrpC
MTKRASQAPRWFSGKATDPGHRGAQGQVNEDAAGCFEPEDKAQHALRGALYIVADGMGGYNAGEIASHMALETVSRLYYAAPAEVDNTTSLCQAILQANEDILRASQEDQSRAGMGTTIVAVVVQEDGQAIVANVGDSSAYLVRDGRPTKLSEDHTWVAEQVEAHLLTAEEARTHKRRHQITRSLGRRPQVEVFKCPYTLQPGDRLVLCSDGLSDVARDEEIARVAAEGEPQAAAERLVALANQRGGPDNIAALVVRYGQRTAAPRAGAWRWVAGVVGALVLVGAGILAGIPLVRRAIGPVTGIAPTSTPQVALAATIRPTLVASATAILTSPPSPSAVPTEQLLAPSTSSPAPSPSRGPTSTLLPTDKPTPTHTRMPSVTPSPTGHAEAPRLVKPGCTGEWVRTSLVRLEWQLGASLKKDESFQLTIERSEHDKDQFEPVESRLSQSPYCSYRIPRDGDYRWRVVVVHQYQEQWQPVSPPSETCIFRYSKKGTPSPGDKQIK